MYGLRPETSRTAVYFSFRLIDNDENVMWLVLRTEWTREALKEFILAARGGLLWCLLPAVREEIRQIRVAQILRYCQPDVLRDAKSLVNFIDRADWLIRPLSHRLLLKV